MLDTTGNDTSRRTRGQVGHSGRHSGRHPSGCPGRFTGRFTSGSAGRPGRGDAGDSQDLARNVTNGTKTFPATVSGTASSPATVTATEPVPARVSGSAAATPIALVLAPERSLASRLVHGPTISTSAPASRTSEVFRKPGCAWDRAREAWGVGHPGNLAAAVDTAAVARTPVTSGTAT